MYASGQQGLWSQTPSCRTDAGIRLTEETQERRRLLLSEVLSLYIRPAEGIQEGGCPQRDAQLRAQVACQKPRLHRLKAGQGV